MQEYPGLHPSAIDDLTFDQVAVFIEYANKLRETIPRADVGIQNLITILISVFGGKEAATKVKAKPKPPLQAIPDMKGMPKVQITKEEIDAFFKAGMPSPMTKWLHDYRSKHK